MEPYLDRLYHKAYDIEKITRLTPKPGGKPHILDKYFGVDCIIRITNGMIVTVQEKIRQLYQMHWDDFTLEHYSNNRGEKGEFFHLCTDIYTYGWGDKENGLIKANIFKTYEVKSAIMNKTLIGKLSSNRDHSSATFFAYPFENFKQDWFIYQYKSLPRVGSDQSGSPTS